MQQVPPQQPNPTSPAGYRPLLPADLTRGMGNAAYGYVAAAAGLGLALGVTVAIAAGHGRVAAAPQISASLATHTSGLSALPASFAGPAPSLLRLVDMQGKPSAAPNPLLHVSEHAVVKHGAHKKHGLRRLLDFKKSAHDHKGAKRKPYVSPNPTVAEVDQPTALQLATTAAAAGPFFLGIQGDVTIASFDSATGTIQTYEGETYLIAKNDASKNPIVFTDYPFDVHYRCDEVGNCTLSHAGASVTAKLTR